MFPTQVGVILIVPVSPVGTLSVPHTGGGDPGCYLTVFHLWLVFPTQVGVILIHKPLQPEPPGVPHTGGGDPV